jgi:5-methylcytosine-specific restriction endonuclease McrA
MVSRLVGDRMLWRPTTYGEQVFLTAYEEIGRHVHLTVARPLTLDFLFSEPSFQEFARLHATLEIFIRCMRGAIFLHPEIKHLPAQDYGKQLAKRGYLSHQLSGSRRFCELLKQAARVGFDCRSAPSGVAKEVRESSLGCYMCGVKLAKSGEKHDQATVEHLWPLSLGGQSDEGNLIAACRDCNEKRGNSITWAWGPVQSTDYRHDARRSANINLRLSLAMAKLMLEASEQGTAKRLQTLKEAAINLTPLFPDIRINDGRHRVYFELFDQVRGAA